MVWYIIYTEKQSKCISWPGEIFHKLCVKAVNIQSPRENIWVLGLARMLSDQFSRFIIRCATSNWLRRGQNAHCIMGKCRQIKCRAIRNYTWVCFKWPKMWIKRLHAKIHNIITIYIHYRTTYFKTITCIIPIIVISNAFACKTHSVFNDFVDYRVTGKRNRGGGALCKTGLFIAENKIKELHKASNVTHGFPMAGKNTLNGSLFLSINMAKNTKAVLSHTPTQQKIISRGSIRLYICRIL